MRHLILVPCRLAVGVADGVRHLDFRVWRFGLPYEPSLTVNVGHHETEVQMNGQKRRAVEFQRCCGNTIGRLLFSLAIALRFAEKLHDVYGGQDWNDRFADAMQVNARL